MNKFKIAILAAAALSISAATATAVQVGPYYSGAVVGTKSGGCGMQLGEYAFVQYVAHDDIAGTPSKLMIQTEGSTFYMENRSLTDEFSGTGKLSATVILNFAGSGGGFAALQTIKAFGSYNITMDNTDPNMVKLNPAKVTLSVPNLGLCTFNMRGVLTPSPVPPQSSPPG